MNDASLWPAALFAGLALFLGFLPAVLTFALRPNAVSAIGLDQVPIPGWFFTGVWVVIYPCMGIAAWTVWARSPVDPALATLALLVLAATLLQTTSFWLTNSLRSTAVIDATGVLLALLSLAAALLAAGGAAAIWLAPLVVWMPTTLTIKIIAIRERTSPSTGTRRGQKA
jgi:tryptophan-rich sensory protein